MFAVRVHVVRTQHELSASCMEPYLRACARAQSPRAAAQRTASTLVPRAQSEVGVVDSAVIRRRGGEGCDTAQGRRSTLRMKVEDATDFPVRRFSPASTPLEW